LCCFLDFFFSIVFEELPVFHEVEEGFKVLIRGWILMLCLEVGLLCLEVGLIGSFVEKLSGIEIIIKRGLLLWRLRGLLWRLRGRNGGGLDGRMVERTLRINKSVGGGGYGGGIGVDVGIEGGGDGGGIGVDVGIEGAAGVLLVGIDGRRIVDIGIQGRRGGGLGVGIGSGLGENGSGGDIYMSP
jgi:hypothetical protein